MLAALGVPVPDWPAWGADHADPDGVPGDLRGLYAGGTLADEAMLVAGALVGDLRSNIPLRPDLALPEARLGRPQLTGAGHAVVDLGDDAFTRGRPHPMIDPSLRLDLLATEAADPDVRVLLLDVVLGHGAEADPAARLAPAVRQALRGADRPLTVVVALIGTRGDPQQRDRQATDLADAGAAVFASNAAAARAAAAVALGQRPSNRRPASDPATPGANHDRPARRTAGGDHRRHRPARRRTPGSGRGRDRRRLPTAGRRRSHRSGASPTTWPPCWPIRVARRPTRRRCAGCWPPGRCWSTSCPPPMRSACSRESSCMPGRRSAGTGPPGRCAARSSGPCCSSDWRPTRPTPRQNCKQARVSR